MSNLRASGLHLLFADDVVLAASLVENLQHALQRFAAECGLAEAKVVWFSATPNAWTVPDHCHKAKFLIYWSVCVLLVGGLV